MMHVELQATCSALGYQEGSKYLKEPDCIESVKDLIRFLKHEDDTLEVRRQLGDAEILQNDLVSLVVQYKSDRILFESVIRLMVNLTQPARLCFNNAIPTDKTARNYYIEVEVCLRKYKRAFADEELFAVLTEKLGELLKLDWEHRHEEDRLLIERLLILVRNILIVPPDPVEEKRTDDDASLHDQLLWALHVSGMEDLLLYLANSVDERQYCMHTLEIISLMFREQGAEMLARAGVQRAVSEKEKDAQQLEIIREQELTEKKERARKLSSRHSRFGGTYLLKNVKSISEKDVIYHRKLDQVSKHSFDITKNPQKIAKNRAPIKDVEVVRRSTLSIRLCLKEFCVQFLENCYNRLMNAVKDNLVREKAQAHDETYYLWALRFFMEFCRLHSGQVELVCETLNVPTFHYIQVNLFNYYEMILTEKKEAIVWARRVHLALKAYQELLQTLHAMDNSKNSHLISSAKVIKCNIFYMMEFRDIFVTLLSKFQHSKHSTSYLIDLVHTSHLFLKMLEKFCNSSRHTVVQTKKKSQKKRRYPKKPHAAAKFDGSQLSEEQLLELWDDISGELSSSVGGEGSLPTDVLPFDAASEVDVDQQKADAMLRIQQCLRGKKPLEAVALLRAAREVWPEKNEFGAANMATEEEFMALREIFMAELAQPPDTIPSEEVDLEEEEDFNEIEEEEMSAIMINEQELNFKEFVSKFARPTILKNYTLLLSSFKTNSSHTNHCIIKMMHRIAVDLKQDGMLFQASLFCIFRKIFALSCVKHFREMAQFARFIIGKFIPAAEENKKIFMEVLFWKTSREAAQMETGYINDSAESNQGLWTEDQKMELQRLFEESKENTEQDALSYIMAHVTDENKSRRQVLRQLRLSELIQSAKDLKAPAPKTVNRSPWTEEQEEELKRVFEDVRNSEDPFGNLLENLSFKKPKNWIKDKLFSLDLIQDKKELRKKRSKNGRRKKNSLEDGEKSDEESDEIEQCSDEEEGIRKESTVFLYSSEEEDSDKLPVTSQSSSKDVNDTNGPGSIPLDVNIDEVLQCLVGHGYAAQIKWIQRSLQRTADDRKEPGEYLGVPIVPLTEDNENAMDDPDFVNFLELIGLSRPVVGQEAFWRIGGELSFTELTQIIEGLTLDENGQPVNSANLKSWLSGRNSKPKRSKASCSTINKDSKLASNNSKRKIVMANLVKKHKNKHKNQDSLQKNNGQRQRKKKKDENQNLEKEKKKKKKKVKMTIDEVAASVTEEQSGSDSDLGPRSAKKGQKRKLLDGSSDDSADDEPLISQVKANVNKDQGRADCTEGESQNLGRRLAEMSDSDSDSDRLVVDEDVGSTPKKRKIAKRVLSDDDEEEATNNQRSLGTSSSLTSVALHKRPRIMESDDSDEEEATNNQRSLGTSSSQTSVALHKRPRIMESDDSDDEKEATNNQRSLSTSLTSDDSDDDKEATNNQRSLGTSSSQISMALHKRPRIMESDDSDDEKEATNNQRSLSTSLTSDDSDDDKEATNNQRSLGTSSSQTSVALHKRPSIMESDDSDDEKEATNNQRSLSTSLTSDDSDDDKEATNNQRSLGTSSSQTSVALHKRLRIMESDDSDDEKEATNNQRSLSTSLTSDDSDDDKEATNNQRSLGTSSSPTSVALHKRPRIMESDGSDDDEEATNNQRSLGTSSSQTSVASHKDLRIVESDDSDEEEATNNQRSLGTSSSLTSVALHKRPRIMESDDSDDEEEATNNQRSLSTSSSHTSVALHKRPRIMESDDSDEEEATNNQRSLGTSSLLTSVALHKRPRIMESDDSDDEEEATNNQRSLSTSSLLTSVASHKQLRIVESDDEEATNNQGSLGTSSSLTSVALHKRPRIMESDDSDDEEEATNNQRSLGTSSLLTSVASHKQLRIMESDDSDDDSNKENHVESNVPPLSETYGDLFDIAKNIPASKSISQISAPMSVETPATCLNTDSFPATLLTLPMDHSDSEMVDDYIPLSTVVKKKKILISEEEDD